MSDLSGMKFGRIFVVKYSHSNKNQKRCYLCRCECGTEKIIVGSSLVSGLTMSCGCLQKERAKENVLKRCVKHKNNYFILDDAAYFTVMDSFGEIHKVYIDIEDVDKCKDIHWKLDGRGYIISHKVGLLHRHILNVRDKSIVVDHIYHNKLDNRKCVLRKCSRTQNSQNRDSKGYRIENGKYCAYITVNKKRVSLGRFDDEEDAIKARKDAEIKYFGEFAYKEE